jgi:hypothetical protein
MSVDSPLCERRCISSLALAMSPAKSKRKIWPGSGGYAGGSGGDGGQGGEVGGGSEGGG